jgi:uncharacterized protein YndB with AHSA1/START domain
MNGQRDRLTLDLRCTIRARPERVFAALTEPDALSIWWGPAGFTTPEIRLDLRKGGYYRFTMQPPDGPGFHLAGEFLEISPPDLLAYTFRWEEPDPDDRETIVRLCLNRVGNLTEVVLSQGDFATQERLTLHVSGWSESFEKLRPFVESDP